MTAARLAAAVRTALGPRDPFDADRCLIAEVVSEPGAGSLFHGPISVASGTRIVRSCIFGDRGKSHGRRYRSNQSRMRVQ